MGMFIDFDRTIGAVPDYAAPYVPLFPVAHIVRFDIPWDEPDNLKKLGEDVQKRRDTIVDRLDVNLPYKTRLQLSEELDVVDKVQLDPNGLRKFHLAYHDSLSVFAPKAEATPETVFPGLVEKNDRVALKTLAGLTDAAFKKRLESDLAAAQKTLRDDFDHGSMAIDQRDDIRGQIQGIQSALSDRSAFKQLRAEVVEAATAPPLPGKRFNFFFQDKVDKFSPISPDSPDEELRQRLQNIFDVAQDTLKSGMRVDYTSRPYMEVPLTKQERKENRETMQAAREALDDPGAFARLREEIKQHADALGAAVVLPQDAKTLGSKYWGTTPNTAAPVTITPQNAPLPTIAPAPAPSTP